MAPRTTNSDPLNDSRPLAAARTPVPESRLPHVGTTIFTVMSALAQEHRAVNLGQGFPDFDCDPRLVDAVTQAGASAVMPLASPIGSGLGLLNPYGIRTIKRRLSVPVIVDAGVGTASDACITMEQGVDGILMNTAIAEARDPVGMARAMRWAVDAGRAAYLAGRMPRREVAVPSTTERGKLVTSRPNPEPCVVASEYQWSSL